MKFESMLIVSTLLIMLSACSTYSKEDRIQTASSNSENKICAEEKTTGSRINRMACRTPEQIQEDKERDQEISEERQH